MYADEGCAVIETGVATDNDAAALTAKAHPLETTQA
jgi:hypothetical protein